MKRGFTCRSIWVCAVAIALTAGQAGIAADDAVTVLDPFAVSAGRIEDFGFDLAGPGKPASKGDAPVWTIHFVVPHTAAAKAGLKPGERVLKFDGRPVMFRTWREWADFRRKKRAAATTGESVTWLIEVESGDRKEIRSLVLKLPTPAPHWGAKVWVPPAERAPAVVSEAGPLAELAQVVLNNGVWTTFGWPFLKIRNAPEFLRKDSVPFLAYYWTIIDEAGRAHKIVVSQLRGRTDIILSSSGKSSAEYLTSPSGLLDEALLWPGRKPLALQKAEAGFRAEVEFWTQKVGKVSPRWPLELLPRDATIAPKRQ